MDDFPWFTEWGGIYMPVGDALGLSCFFAILSMILSLAGYLIYLLYKLVSKGIKELARGHPGKAMIYLAVPITLGLMAANLLFVSVRGAAAYAEDERRLTEFYALANSGQLVEIRAVETSVCRPVIDVTNLTEDMFLCAYFVYEGCEAHRTLKPGETVRIYCPSDSRWVGITLARLYGTGEGVHLGFSGEELGACLDCDAD